MRSPSSVVWPQCREQHPQRCYANNPVECDHGRLKSRLRPMRGPKRRRSAIVVAAGHAFVQNIRRGHYELALDVSPSQRVSVAFTELAVAL